MNYKKILVNHGVHRLAFKTMIKNGGRKRRMINEKKRRRE